MKRILLALITLTALTLTLSLSAEAYLIDTGAPIDPSGGGTIMGGTPGRMEAVQFSLAGAAHITSIQTAMTYGAYNNVFTAYLYGGMYKENGIGYIPDEANQFATGTFTLTTTGVSHWVGLTGLNLDLAAGTYWLAVQSNAPNNNSYSYFAGQVPNPTAYYADKALGIWIGHASGSQANLPLRLDGTSAVPEPSTYALLCISLGVVGYARKRMNRTAA